MGTSDVAIDNLNNTTKNNVLSIGFLEFFYFSFKILYFELLFPLKLKFYYLLSAL